MSAAREDPMDVRADEFGTLRLFATDNDSEIAGSLSAETAHRYLGDVTLRTDKVEVAPARSVEGLGLAAYLREGYGISSDSLASQTSSLNSLSGVLVFLPASAFGGEAQQIVPHPELRFIGLFHEEKAAAPGPMTRPDAAKGAIGTPPESKAPTGESGGRSTRLLVLAALLLAAILLAVIGI